MELLLVLMAVLAGALVPVQAGLNMLLRQHLSDPTQAAFISFVVGTVVLLAYCLVLRHQWPSLHEMSRIPPVLWIGGVFGAFFVATTIYLGPRIGAATMTAFILAGQLSASLVLDHFGAIGFPEHAVSPWRIVGVVLLAAGAWMIKAF